jgi:hypothetical protein
MICVMKSIVSSTAAVATVLAVALAGCGGGKTSAPSTVTQTVYGGSPTTAPAATPQLPTPNYKQIQRNVSDRKDGKYSYYVVIDPVDLSNDGFKQNVKVVLQEIAKDNGGPDFSARVFDDEAVAKTYLSDKTDPPLDLDVRKAHNAQEEQHLIAGYLGGIDAYSAQPSTAASAYNISWFPAAFTSSPNVGQYVKLNDQWKP